MDGPQHYIKAEQYLGDATDARTHGETADAALLASIAQVHATLALAAATAISDDRNWNDIAGPRLGG